MHAATFRYYGELNDLLPEHMRQRDYAYRFWGRPAVKDAIEAMGVPHTEVDVILANGAPVTFRHHIAGGDRIAVYPVFELLDVSTVTRLRPRPLRNTKFVLDVHLGRLARRLRMLGFDAAYRRDYADRGIINAALGNGRIILTRDRGTLKDGRVTHGYCVRATDPDRQLAEVVRRFDLAGRIEPFTRCMRCNGSLRPVARGDVEGRVPLRVFERHDEFKRCDGCGNVYWKGSHYRRMRSRIEEIAHREETM